jgi:hypothetical protein
MITPAITSTSTLFQVVLVAAVATLVNGAKVDVCHVRGTGVISLLNIGEAALSAHIKHGDFLPGSRLSCIHYDSTCLPQQEPVCQGLGSCDTSTYEEGKCLCSTGAVSLDGGLTCSECQSGENDAAGQCVETCASTPENRAVMSFGAGQNGGMFETLILGNTRFVISDTVIGHFYGDCMGCNTQGGFLPVTTGAWHSVTVRHSSVGQQVWIDGVLSPVSLKRALNTAAGPVVIGYGFWSPYRGYAGLVDESAIWSRALTDNEIATVFQIGMTGGDLHSLLGAGSTLGNALTNYYDFNGDLEDKGLDDWDMPLVRTSGEAPRFEDSPFGQAVRVEGSDPEDFYWSEPVAIPSELQGNAFKTTFVWYKQDC